jgi:hypothetical protein
MSQVADNELKLQSGQCKRDGFDAHCSMVFWGILVPIGSRFEASRKHS